jgi:hypothetical protein
MQVDKPGVNFWYLFSALRVAWGLALPAPTLLQKIRIFEHKIMFNWVLECLSPAFP